MINKIIKKILWWIKFLFGKAETTPIKAKDVVNNWIVIKYHDQNICIRKSEIVMWNKLGRNDRRAMAQRFKVMEKKKQIRFQEIEGKTVAIWNKDYQERAERAR